MSLLKIKIIVGSTRANRFSEKTSQWILAEGKKRSEIEVELLDLRDYPLPFFEEAMPPGLAKKQANGSKKKHADGTKQASHTKRASHSRMTPVSDKQTPKHDSKTSRKRHGEPL